jgi:hypothetical protein
VKFEGLLYSLIGPRGIRRPGIIHLAMRQARLVTHGIVVHIVDQCDVMRRGRDVDMKATRINPHIAIASENDMAQSNPAAFGRCSQKSGLTTGVIRLSRSHPGYPVRGNNCQLSEH